MPVKFAAKTLTKRVTFVKIAMTILVVIHGMKNVAHFVGQKKFSREKSISIKRVSQLPVKIMSITEARLPFPKALSTVGIYLRVTELTR
jgi:hypothetical protein